MKDILLEVKENGFDVYVKCKSSEVYLLHHFPHIKREDINANLYRIRTSHAVRFNSDGEKEYLYGGNIVVGDGEWECAIKEVGAADFFGGFHGDENLIETRLMADGEEVKLNREYKAECDELTFFQRSYLNRCDTPNDNTAVHIKRYRINIDGIYIEQEILWLQAVKLECGYLGMLPVKRAVGEYQITDRAVALDGENAGIICDVSEESSDTVISKLNNDTSRVRLYGEKNGFSVCVEHILSPNLTGKSFYLKIRPWDNKYYFRCCSDIKTAVGDRWHAFSHYDFDIK